MALSISSTLHPAVCSSNVSMVLNIRWPPLKARIKYEHEPSLCHVQTVIWPCPAGSQWEQQSSAHQQAPNWDQKSHPRHGVPIACHWWTEASPEGPFVSGGIHGGEGHVLGLSASSPDWQPRDREARAQRTEGRLALILTASDSSKQVPCACQPGASCTGRGPLRGTLVHSGYREGKTLLLLWRSSSWIKHYIYMHRWTEENPKFY